MAVTCKRTATGPGLCLILILSLLITGCVFTALPEANLSSMTMEERINYYRDALKTPQGAKRTDLRLALKKQEFMMSMIHMDSGKALLNENNMEGAIEAFTKSLEIYPSNQRAAQLLRDAQHLKQSTVLFNRAETAFKHGDTARAEILCAQALDLDPGNSPAMAMMAEITRNKPIPSDFGIALDNGKTVSFRFKNTPISDVFDAISKMTDINFLFDKDIRKSSSVTLFVKDVSMARFLDMLFKTNSLSARQFGRGSILIYPNTSQKSREYQDYQVQTIYLSNIKTKEAADLLKSILKLKDVTTNETNSSITVRADRASLDLAESLISINDVPVSEVVLDVEFLEVGTKIQEEVGLSVSDSITFGVGETSSGIETGGKLATFGSVYDIRHLTSKDYYLSLPTATLNLLKEDGDTRLLARPSIRVSYNKEATILIGERIPLRSNRTVETDGRVTYDYTYQDVGIKLVVTPEINLENSIRLNLKVEVSALGDNVGTLDDPQYAISTRSAYTTLTVDDGNTVIIGGLMKQEERDSMKKMPLLSDLPILGRLFSSRGADNNATDLLPTIKPLVIRGRNLPQSSRTLIGSGTETNLGINQEEPNQQHYRNFNQDDN